MAEARWSERDEDALKSEWKAMHQAFRQWSIDKGKEKGKAKSKDKAKEGTSDMSNVKCFFRMERGHAQKDCPKFSAWLAEKKTVSRAECKLH